MAWVDAFLVGTRRGWPHGRQQSRRRKSNQILRNLRHETDAVCVVGVRSRPSNVSQAVLVCSLSLVPLAPLSLVLLRRFHWCPCAAFTLVPIVNRLLVTLRTFTLLQGWSADDYEVGGKGKGETTEAAEADKTR